VYYSHYFSLLSLTIASERSLRMSQHKQMMWELLCKNKNTCLDLRTVISKHAMHVIKKERKKFNFLPSQKLHMNI
jgi:hypothetical protein